MTTRKTILFLIALVLLIVVIALQFTGRGDDKGLQKTTDALAAKYDIPPYTVIRGDDLQKIRVPEISAGSVYTQPADLDGLLTTTEIRAGNAVKSEDVIQVPEDRAPDENTLIFSFYVPTARVIGGQLRPGHFIDVLATRADTREEGGASLWLARGMWVVGVQQSSGQGVARPTVAAYGTAQPTPRAGIFGEGTTFGEREGPANLVVVAAHREIAKMIGDYFGAQLYDAWVYIRPSGSASKVGRIDGVVFEDADPLGIQSRAELGLDGVAITLFDEGGVTKGSAQTSGGGQFTFDNLAPANYRVAVTVPEGYTPVTAREASFYLADGQNQHLWFGEQKVVKPEAKVVKVAPTPQPTPRPTPAPTRLAQSGQDAYALRMSNQEGGPEVSGFPAGVAEVYAVLDFKNVPADTPYKVLVQSSGVGAQERVASVGTWKGGSGSFSVKVMPWAGDTFAEGAYITSLETGAEDTSRGFKPWTVSGEVTRTVGPVQTPDHTGPDEPDTDSLLDSQR